MVLALAKEIAMRKNELENETIATIYFGGGTPSLLSIEDLRFLIDEVYRNYNISENPEITLEANPDDLNDERIKQLAELPINRLSIGIQSFFEEDLRLMNRAHNAEEAKKCLETATKYFDNITVDLIYGIPNMSNENWLQNIETALSFGIPHISSYALTVEPKTALQSLISKGKIDSPNDAVAQEHFNLLVKTLSEKGFVHYELSNFGKPGYFSANNTAYWTGKKYIGIGPSAHSFNGTQRSWNIANNSLYIKSILENKLPNEVEILTKTDCYNEAVMTGLRTMWGISLEKIEADFGKTFLNHLLKEAEKHLQNGHLFVENNFLKTTQKGMFFSDGISSDLFVTQ